MTYISVILVSELKLLGRFPDIVLKEKSLIHEDSELVLSY